MNYGKAKKVEAPIQAAKTARGRNKTPPTTLTSTSGINMRTKRPEPGDYQLTEESIDEIKIYNERQKKRGKVIAVSFILLVVLLFFTCIGWEKNYIYAIIFLCLSPYLYIILDHVEAIDKIGRLFCPPNKLTIKYEGYINALNEYEEEKRRQKVKYWFSLSGLEFENEVTNLLIKKRYNAEKTSNTRDGGVDIIIKNPIDSSITIVQCKAHKKPVGPHVIRDLYGTMIATGAKDAILINLGGFTIGVKTFAASKGITLVDVYGLIEMQKE